MLTPIPAILHGASFTATTAINGSRYATTQDSSNFYAPIRTYWAILTRNLPYPAGTSQDALFPTFRAQADLPSNANWTIASQALYLEIVCEVA